MADVLYQGYVPPREDVNAKRPRTLYLLKIHVPSQLAEVMSWVNSRKSYPYKNQLEKLESVQLSDPNFVLLRV